MVANRQIYTQVMISRGMTEIDVADFVTRVEVNLGNVSSVGTGSSGGDGVVRQAFLSIQNDANNRFSPLDATSSWNYDGMTFDPLLKPNRELKIWVAAMPIGVAPGPNDYELLFHGFMGDSIRTEGQRVEVELRDLAKRLQDRVIITPREYGAPIEDGGVRADIVMQQILDDEFGPGVITLEVPSLPSFACPPFTVEFVSVWDVLQNIAKEFGWFVGYRYDAVSKSFKLTLLEPPRNKDINTADWHFDWEDDIYVQDLDITDRDIRNRIVVVYRDSAGKRDQVTVSDPASIAEFGLKPMQIDETDTELIKTSVQALQMANYALADLSGQRATNSLTLPFLPRVDLYDGITVDDPRISSETEFYGVESVRHTLDFEGGSFQTEVVAAERVIGAHQRWLQMQARKGSDGNPPSAVWPVRPNTVLTIAAFDTNDEGKRRADIRCQGANDQRDINLALDRVGVGGKVILLEGTFIITEPILMPDNVLLEGQGSSTIIFLDDNRLTDMNMIENKDQVSGNTGIMLSNFVLDGNRANQDADLTHHGVYMEKSTEPKISNVTVLDMNGLGFILTESHFGQITNCIARGGKLSGFLFWDSDSIILTNCEATNNVFGGPGEVGSGAHFLGGNGHTISNNIFIGNEAGLRISDSIDSTISSNVISENDNGMRLDNVHDSTITGNTIIDNGADGLDLFSSTNNDIMSNVIKGNGKFIDDFFNNVFLDDESHRNNIQTNIVRKKSETEPDTVFQSGVGIYVFTGAEDNFITNNDLLDAGKSEILLNDGLRTETRPGNRPSQGTNALSYYTDFSEWPTGETPYDWFGWHTQDYISQVYTVIEDGEPALFMGMNSGNLWRIWGPKDAPAARNIEIFAEFKITSISAGNTNPMGIWMRVSGWNESRLGGIYVAADGTTFAIKRRNFTGFTTLNSQAALIAANTWYKVRFRAEGQDFYAKIWESADPEPGVWTLQASENSGDHMTGARIGLGNGVNAANVFYRQFGYAIGGNAAPGN